MIWKMIAKFLGPIIAILSPTIKEELGVAVNALYVKAKATSNPLDDLGVEILAGVLGITLTEK